MPPLVWSCCVYAGYMATMPYFVLRYLLTDSRQRRARSSSATSPSIAHDCEFMNILPYSFAFEPRGLLSSSKALTYHSPSQQVSLIASFILRDISLNLETSPFLPRCSASSAISFAARQNSIDVNTLSATPLPVSRFSVSFQSARPASAMLCGPFQVSVNSSALTRCSQTVPAVCLSL